ncbi:MAG: hypothetical protein M1820_001750 [Bogoriella megaspora]|nr:MAG: hypothetical protein M1820_001750 [Bogoriella megaspora]
MTVPYDEPFTTSRMLSASTGSLTSSRHQSSQIAKTYRQAAQLFLTRRLPEALSTIDPVISSPEQSNGHENGDSLAPAPVAAASRNTRIKVWSFYLTLLNSIIELGLEEGKHAFGSTRWRQLASKAREGSIWEDVVQIGYGGHEGEVDAEVVINLATLLLTHSPTQKLNQSRLETYLSASAHPVLNISSTHFSHASQYHNGHSTSQTPTPRRPSPARSNTGTSTPRDLHTRLKVLELYTLHVLPKNDEWEYAKEFISMSALLDDERKEAFLQALGQLKEEMDEGQRKEEEIEREREREEQEQKKEEEQKRREEEDRRRREREREREGKAGPRTGGDSNEGNVKVRETQKQSGPGRGSQAKQPAKKSPARQPPSSLYKRASSMVMMLQASFLEAVKNMSGNPMLVLRFLLFLVTFLLVGRREVRERLKRALGQSWDKVRRTVGMGVKVSYI